jgi:iron(III) transport system substrate-binding protein
MRQEGLLTRLMNHVNVGLHPLAPGPSGKLRDSIVKNSSAKLVCTALWMLLAVVFATFSDGWIASVGAQEPVDAAWQKVVDAAKKEGSVNLYNVASPIQNTRLLAAFNSLYPDIVVNVTRGAAELPPRVAAEIDSKSDGADVFLYSDPQFFHDYAAKFLDIDGPNVRGWSSDAWEVPKKAVIVTVYPWTMFVWNTTIFPKGFKSWDDLLDKSVKGKIALRKDATRAMAGTLDFMESKLGTEYVTKLGKQSPKYYTSIVPMGQAVASGEVGVTIYSSPPVVNDLKQKGAPIDFAYPNPGFAILWNGGIPGTAKRPNAARLLMDFIMSPAGQEAINGNGYGKAGRAGVKGALDMSTFEVWDGNKYPPDVMKGMQARFDKYFSN